MTRLVGKSTHWLTMTSYYKTLDMREKEWYKEKLEAVSLLINNDLYSPSHAKKFRSDMSQ